MMPLFPESFKLEIGRNFACFYLSCPYLLDNSSSNYIQSQSDCNTPVTVLSVLCVNSFNSQNYSELDMTLITISQIKTSRHKEAE